MQEVQSYRRCDGEKMTEDTGGDYTVTTVALSEPCPGCDGKGWQARYDGVRVWCPMCNGSGKKQYPVPVVPPYIPPPYVPYVPDPNTPWWPTPYWTTSGPFCFTISTKKQ
jgi:hypothetical protein